MYRNRFHPLSNRSFGNYDDPFINFYGIRVIHISYYWVGK